MPGRVLNARGGPPSQDGRAGTGILGGMATTRRETNVRLPQSAVDALAWIADSRNTSRDETVRQLLAEHLAIQEPLPRDDRCCHIATVLRYPPAPRHRREPKSGCVLRLRLDSGVADRARAVSLQLPGQAPRAHPHYQARLLSDAVLTAIARVKPFTDEFLTGLMPLLRHRAALGLWHLAVAATSTGPEDAVRDAAELLRAEQGARLVALTEKQKQTLLVDEALDETTAWHLSDRFTVAANLARIWLAGPDAAAHEQELYDQNTEWNEKRQDLRARTDKREVRRGVRHGFDWSGRGGAAVWRASRKVALDDFEDWLVRRPVGEQTRFLPAPGWQVRTPESWRAHLVSGDLSDPFATWLRDGRVLAFRWRERTALWPLTQAPVPTGCTPVAGVEPMLEAARGVPPQRMREFIEAMLLGWDRDDEEDDDVLGLVIVPIDKAEQFGLVGAEERRLAKTQARATNLELMRRVIASLPPEHELTRATLTNLMGNARRFAAVAQRAKLEFAPARATYSWWVHSVAEEVVQGLRADALGWLAVWVRRRHDLELRTVGYARWKAAYHRYWRPPSPWWPPTPQV